ncbi:MAG: hypothetical protein WDN04_25725 [Rhodospirillales bacterium]
MTTIPAIPPRVPLPPVQARPAAPPGGDAKMQKAAQDFTAVALGEMLSPMFDTMDASGGNFGGGGGEARVETDADSGIRQGHGAPGRARPDGAGRAGDAGNAGETLVTASFAYAVQAMAKLLTEENAALNAMDFARAGALLAPKHAAADALAAAWRAAPETDAPQNDLRQLGELAEQNRKLLNRAMRVQRRVLELVARAAAAHRPARATVRADGSPTHEIRHAALLRGFKARALPWTRRKSHLKTASARSN